jgi:TfoX/Sxy family transcriptional regulator of competence genes
MAYDEILEQRIRDVLNELNVPDYLGKRMFGGVGFMLQGNMACGVLKDALILRVGVDRYEKALAWPHAKPFDTTGRPMKGWVMISSEGCESNESLKDFVQYGVDIALSLPPK